jgi:pimeloyl-ACP methyl ester carboxylesterase
VRLRNEQAAVPKSKETVKGEILQLGARIGHDVSGRLHLVTAPVFVAAGEFDGIAPKSNSEEIVKRLPNASLAVYQGGHIFTAQDRRAIADIQQFLTAD